MNRLVQTFKEKTTSLGLIEWTIVTLSPLIPLLFNFPYRINLFLAWEGAYRMSEGQIPFRDFGTPVGYVFWILPALFFKIFGPTVYTLIKVQVFTNLVSNITFRGVLQLFNLQKGLRIVVVLVYVMSYSMFNFWPWYNHLVFVLELISVFYILKYMLKEQNVLYLIISALFVALAFMTKQDTGVLAILIIGGLLSYYLLIDKKFKPVVIFAASYIGFMGLLIVPFLGYEFGYWFNMGQEPHNSRVNAFDLISEILGASKWLKFYLILIVLIIIYRIESNRNFIFNLKEVLFALLTLFIIFQAAIIQLTSYTPVDGNIYFHSFAIAFLLYQLPPSINLNKVWIVSLLLVFTGLWWSEVYWNKFIKSKVQSFTKSSDVDKVSKNTYIIKDAKKQVDRGKWVLSDIESFERIKLPEQTVAGIATIKNLPIVLEKEDKIKVLNMSELTPLARELPYKTEVGVNFPMWYHKGVSFFGREVDFFCAKIERGEYDLILFEDIPDLFNFYPYEVRDCIQKEYKLVNRFLAPRIPEFSYIEVYVKQ